MLSQDPESWVHDWFADQWSAVGVWDSMPVQAVVRRPDDGLARKIVPPRVAGATTSGAASDVELSTAGLLL